MRSSSAASKPPASRWIERAFQSSRCRVPPRLRAWPLRRRTPPGPPRADAQLRTASATAEASMTIPDQAAVDAQLSTFEAELAGAKSPREAQAVRDRFLGRRNSV